jgi:hypothetical protein
VATRAQERCIKLACLRFDGVFVGVEACVKLFFNRYPIDGKAKECLYVGHVRETRRYVGEDACVDIEIQAILAYVEAEYVVGQRAVGKSANERLMFYTLDFGQGGLPGFFTPFFHKYNILYRLHRGAALHLVNY